jgi:hypothetical protein
MKSHSLLCLLLFSWGLLSCDKKEPRPLTAASKSEETEAPIPLKFQAGKLPSGSQEDYDRYVKAGGDPSIADDIPPLDREVTGVYSSLGAARVFKAICGFDIPNWMKPLKGNFFVSIRKSGSVRQSWLEYKIDPARRAELEKLITEANTREFPQRHPVKFYSGTSPAVSSSAYIDFKPDGKVKESMAVRIDEEGIVTLRASLGPVGWDD